MHLKHLRVAALVATFTIAPSALASELTRDAAIGGAIGGALGGAIGAEVAGKEGAVVGAGVGAAAGAAIATKDDGDHHHDGKREVILVPVVEEDHPGRFCPPGQAKKGRC
jgi:hypothetical protein